MRNYVETCKTFVVTIKCITFLCILYHEEIHFMVHVSNANGEGQFQNMILRLK